MTSNLMNIERIAECSKEMAQSSNPSMEKAGQASNEVLDSLHSDGSTIWKLSSNSSKRKMLGLMTWLSSTKDTNKILYKAKMDQVMKSINHILDSLGGIYFQYGCHVVLWDDVSRNTDAKIITCCKRLEQTSQTRTSKPKTGQNSLRCVMIIGTKNWALCQPTRLLSLLVTSFRLRYVLCGSSH